MILPEPNSAFRRTRRQDLDGFEALVRDVIETDHAVRIEPAGRVPRSLDDLAGIVADSTRGAYALSIFADEDPSLAVYRSPLFLPWECYDRRDGDIYVFMSGAMSQVGLTERSGHKFYRKSDDRVVARVDEPMGFLRHLEDDVFETVRGDLLVCEPVRFRSIAYAIVRPIKRGLRVLN